MSGGERLFFRFATLKPSKFFGDNDTPPVELGWRSRRGGFKRP
jgi:hypothetical protein